MNEALVLLVLVWAVLLLPSAIRSRNASPHATVGGFERAMDVLRNSPTPRADRGTGRPVMVPGDAGRIVAGQAHHGVTPTPVRSEDPVMARRRSWFVRLLTLNGGLFLIALVGSGWLWWPFVLSVVVTAGYVAVLRHLKLQADQARAVVRSLDAARDPEPAAAPTVMVGAGAQEAAGSGTVRLRRWDG